MPTKRSIIVALVGVNLFLLAALVLGSYSLPAAHAQGIGAGGNYIAVTCQVDKYFDMFYLVDLQDRRLHGFLPTRQLDGTVKWVGSRNLAEDFGRGE